MYSEARSIFYSGMAVFMSPLYGKRRYSYFWHFAYLWTIYISVHVARQVFKMSFVLLSIQFVTTSPGLLSGWLKTEESLLVLSLSNIYTDKLWLGGLQLLPQYRAIRTTAISCVIHYLFFHQQHSFYSPLSFIVQFLINIVRHPISTQWKELSLQ